MGITSVIEWLAGTPYSWFASLLQPLTISIVDGTADGQSAALEDMSIDHGGFDIFMPKQFLHGADTCPEPQVRGIVAILEEVGDKIINLGHAHFTRMPLVMVDNKLAQPADIGLFGAEGVMAIAEGFAILIQQLPAFPR